MSGSRVLNLRNVPEELMRELRAEAARAGQPFHAFCVGLLETSLYSRRMPQVTVHPPIETLGPVTQAAIATMAARAARAVLNLPPAPEGAVTRSLNGVEIPMDLAEIEIT